MAKKTDKGNKAVAPMTAQGTENAVKSAAEFFDQVATTIEQARQFVGRTADLTMCVTYFEVGRMIVEKEQNGKRKAEYGTGLMNELSAYLNGRFKRGFSVANLKNARQFYLTYASRIRQTLSSELNEGESLPVRSGELNYLPIIKKAAKYFKLGWSHYLILTRINDEAQRSFYEIEAEKRQWTVRQLEREYASSLYERLALSRNKDEVMRLSKEGQTIEKPRDVLKDPLVLEFLGLEESPKYSESDLENAIIGKLSQFLYELGTGFLFDSRQKRFTFNERHFFVDLVFYNKELPCYVLIDLKTDDLKHQDLGQMQMYVNYYDRYVKKEYEKPTIGILLCGDKDDSIVELTLPKDANIYAAQYSLYLPDKAVLQRKLAEWVKEFEDEHGADKDKKQGDN
jgi:predicted nuclease of restriction endonuclease-like (RecB) superfamily